MIIPKELASVFIEEVKLANREMLESFYSLDVQRMAAVAHKIAPCFKVMGVEETLYAPICELTSPPAGEKRIEFFNHAASYVRNIRNLEEHLATTFRLQ
jgi:hypothetical protein